MYVNLSTKILEVSWQPNVWLPQHLFWQFHTFSGEQLHVSLRAILVLCQHMFGYFRPSTYVSISTVNQQNLPFSDPTHPPTHPILCWRNTWMFPRMESKFKKKIYFSANLPLKIKGQIVSCLFHLLPLGGVHKLYWHEDSKR